MKRFLIVSALVFMTGAAYAQEPVTEHDAFLKKNPSVKGIGWKEKGTKVVIRLKSGETETYDLNKVKEKTALTARYGTIPVAPPPPPQVEAPPARAAADELVPPPPPPPVPEKARKKGTEPMLCAPPLPVYEQ